MQLITLDLSKPTRTADGGYILQPPHRKMRTSELLELGRYDENPSFIDDKIFPFRSSKLSWPRVIKLVDMGQYGFQDYYDGDPYYRFRDALRVLDHTGLDRPTYEDALLFGWQHPTAQLEHLIMFPHEPVYGTGFKDFDGLVVELGRFQSSEDGRLGRKIITYEATGWYRTFQLVGGVVSSSRQPSDKPFELPRRPQLIVDLDSFDL